MKITAYWNAKPYEVDLDVQPSNNSWYETRIVFPDGKTVTGSGEDYFDSIASVRAIIEPHGWLLGINASRLDVGKLLDLDNPNESLVSFIVNNKILSVHALDAAPFGNIGTLEYQRRFFQEKYFDASKALDASNHLKNVTKTIKKLDPNRNVVFITPLLNLLPIIYPISFLFISFPNPALIYLSAWIIIGILIYAIVIAINIEAVIITGRTTAGLVVSIAFPLISILGVIIYKIVEAGTAITNMLSTIH